MTALIGIGGAATAGKDTVANYLAHNHGFTVIGMSDPLVDALRTLDPVAEIDGNGIEWTFSQVLDTYGYTKAKERAEVRRLLRVFGTEVGRGLFGENVWVELAIKRINALRERGQSVIMSSIRFPNEIAMIEQLGGDTIWVDRPSVADMSGHASETSVRPEDFGMVIDNIGTLDELYQKVESAYAQLVVPTEPELLSTVILSETDRALLEGVLRTAQSALSLTQREQLRDEFVDRVVTEARKVSH